MKNIPNPGCGYALPLKVIAGHAQSWFIASASRLGGEPDPRVKTEQAEGLKQKTKRDWGRICLPQLWAAQMKTIPRKRAQLVPGGLASQLP